jgi:hypothetical protein
MLEFIEYSIEGRRPSWFLIESVYAFFITIRAACISVMYSQCSLDPILTDFTHIRQVACVRFHLGSFDYLVIYRQAPVVAATIFHPRDIFTSNSSDLPYLRLRGLAH